MQCVKCEKTGDGGYGGWEAYRDGNICPECFEALNASPPVVTKPAAAESASGGQVRRDPPG